MTSPTYQLAVLGPDHLSLMRELNALFGRAFDEVDTYSGQPPDDSYLTTFLVRSHVVVIVAPTHG